MVVLWGCAPDGAPAQGVADAGSELSTNVCVADEQCPAGMVCEGCPGQSKTCVPGCRVDAQCPTFMVCTGRVLCTTCPCPPGWCDLDPCRDVDGDGFAAAPADGPVTCPGKKVGDCDDARRDVNPGQAEVCANGLDDDCDGKADTHSDACRTCEQGQRYCSTNRNCGQNETCDRGCCTTCGTPPAPTCDPTQCVLPGGVDPDTGCFVESVCGNCQSCPSTTSYVCGLNGATYQNGCYAEAAGTKVLYAGSCNRGEQHRCQGPQDCFGNQYCRDTEPDAGVELRCTRRNTCVHDVDCAEALGGVTVLCPDGGIAPLGCTGFKCVTRCQ